MPDFNPGSKFSGPSHVKSGDLFVKLIKNPKPPNRKERRILCIGCSFTTADVGRAASTDNPEIARPQHAYPSILGSLLPNDDVWNCGLCGGGTYVHYKYRLSDYIKAKPDIVILQIMEPNRTPSVFLPEEIFRQSCGNDENEFAWHSNAPPPPYIPIWFENHRKTWDAPKAVIRKIIDSDWAYIKMLYDGLKCKFIYMINNQRYPYSWYAHAGYDIEFVKSRCEYIGKSKLVVTKFSELTEDNTGHPRIERHRATAYLLKTAINQLDDNYEMVEVSNNKNYNAAIYSF
jgi:hypothetical protein